MKLENIIKALGMIFVSIGIIAMFIVLIFILRMVYLSETRDANRNQRFDECLSIAEQNQLGQEFIKNCMN